MALTIWIPLAVNSTNRVYTSPFILFSLPISILMAKNGWHVDQNTPLAPGDDLFVRQPVGGVCFALLIPI